MPSPAIFVLLQLPVFPTELRQARGFQVVGHVVNVPRISPAHHLSIAPSRHPTEIYATACAK